MKSKYRYLLWSLVLLLPSCASSPIVLAPVGPGPAFNGSNTPGKGNLVVYSQTQEYGEDMAVPFYSHTGYWIYKNGKRFKRVWNHQNDEDEDPSIVTLAPGKYVVRAEAELYGPVTVPVVIEADRTTRVVLQPGWKPPEFANRSDLVKFHRGYAVGWKAGQELIPTGNLQSNNTAGK